MTRAAALAAGRRRRLEVLAQERQHIEGAVLAIWHRDPATRRNASRTARLVVLRLALDPARIRAVRRFVAAVRSGQSEADTVSRGAVAALGGRGG